jgi:HAD superfamily hydrolase (TIGR01509 family)
MKNTVPYIFDLTGVLFNVDKIELCKQIGLWRTFMYGITQRKNPVNRYLEALHELSLREPHCEQRLQHCSYQFPTNVSNFFMGNAIGSQVANELIERIDTLAQEGFFVSEREYELIRRITTLAFATDLHTPSFKPIKPMIKLLQELRQQPEAKLYLLSNLDEPSYHYLEKTYPEFFALFDGVTISAMVHMIKPYKNIYEHVLNTYAIDPHKALFLDDQPENVAAGKSVGLKAVQFTSPQQAIAVAREHLKIQ